MSKTRPIESLHKRHSEQIAEKEAHENHRIQKPCEGINWDELVLTLRHIEIRILEVLYLPDSQPFSLTQLYRKLSPLGFCHRRIRRKLEKLESKRRLRIVRSTASIGCPIPDLHKNIKTLSVMWNLRDRNL